MVPLIRQPYRFLQLQVSPGFLLSHVLTSEISGSTSLSHLFRHLVDFIHVKHLKSLLRDMFSSNASQRPRQRTFTSCTECRRRKQRCNQARDRPCNNCARRYPPVVCEYENSSSPSPLNRNADPRDSLITAQNIDPGSDVAGTAYIQTTQPTISYVPPTSTSDTYYNSDTYNPSTLADYRQYQGGAPATNPQYIATSGGYTANSGYYQDQTNYSVVSSTQGQSGFYPIADQQRNDWLATNGDSTTFIGSNSDYYYVDADPANQTSPKQP